MIVAGPPPATTQSSRIRDSACYQQLRVTYRATQIDVHQQLTLPALDHFLEMNQRPEYGKQYREEAGKQRMVKKPVKFEKQFSPIESGRREVLILGQAGQRIVTAGENYDNQIEILAGIHHYVIV